MRNNEPRIFTLPVLGRFALVRDHGGAASWPGGLKFGTNLKASLYRSGIWQASHDFGSGVITDTGAEFVANAFSLANGSIVSAFEYHACGIGTTAAAAADTTLGNVTGAPARVQGSEDVTGSKTYVTVATIAFTSSLAITEWGLFSASSAGTMLDRKVFSAINVVNGDSIQFTYTLTVSSGT
jgi:hypothetical protein